MSTGTVYALTLLTALGCGFMGGAMFVFSVMVMPGLRARPPAEGAAAMSAINDAANGPRFGGFFTLTALLALFVLGHGLFTDVDGRGWRIAGAAVYLVGTIGVTAVVNIPMNNTLGRMNAASEEGAEHWRAFVVKWTAWNHLRALCGALAVVGLVLGLP